MTAATTTYTPLTDAELALLELAAVGRQAAAEGRAE